MDIFDLGNAPSIGNLFSYVEVIRNIANSSKVMIIRFNNKFRISRLELDTLNKIIKQLEMNKISIVFSGCKCKYAESVKAKWNCRKGKEGNYFFYIKDDMNMQMKSIKEINWPKK